MRHLTIICAMVLAGCGGDRPIAAPIPTDMLQPCPGWEGRPPQTQGELLRAALAERTGRLRCNEKLGSGPIDFLTLR